MTRAPADWESVVVEPAAGMLAALDRAAARPLVEIVAAKGWGKSSLVTSWARHRGVPVLTATADDREATVLASRLIAALAADGATPVDLGAAADGATPVDLGAAADGATPVDLGAAAAVDAPLDLLVARCLAALRQPPTRIVIDRADELRGSAAAGLLRALLAVPGARLRLVVASRVPSGLVEPRTLARGDAHQWGASELRLDQQAMAEALAARTSGMDAALLDRLAVLVWRDTDGWPGVLDELAAALSSGAEQATHGPVDAGAAAVLRSPAILRRVTEILLGEEPDEVREVLRTIALLDVVALDELAAVGGQEPATLATQIEALARRGLLRMAGTGQRRQLSLAPLVRRATLASLDADHAPSLAAITEALRTGTTGDRARLFQVALAGRANELLHDLLATDGAALVASDPTTVRTAIDRLEAADPPDWLIALHADARAADGSPHAALALLDQAAAGDESAIMGRRCRILADLGWWAELTAIPDRWSLDEPSAVSGPAGVEALAAIAHGYTSTGEFERAADVLARARRILTARDPSDDAPDWRLAHAAVALETARVASVDPSRYPAAHREAFTRAEQVGDPASLSRVRLLHAEWQARQGRTTEALFELDRATALLPTVGATALRRIAHTVRGNVLLRVGRLDDAEAAARNALDTVDAGVTTSPAEARPRLLVADVARTRGEVVRARGQYDDAEVAARVAGDRVVLEAIAVGRARLASDRRGAGDVLRDTLAGPMAPPAAILAWGWWGHAANTGVAADTQTAADTGVAADTETAADTGVAADTETAADTGVAAGTDAAAVAIAAATADADERLRAEAATLAAVRSDDPVTALSQVARTWHRLHDPVWATRAELGAARRATDADTRSRIVDLECRLAELGVHLDQGDVAHRATVGLEVPPRVLVRVLGGLRVRIDGSDVHLPEQDDVLPAAIALLALRAPRSVAREQFALLLPGEQRHERSLDVLLSRVRAALTTPDGRLAGVSGGRTALSLRTGAVAHDLTLLRLRTDAAERALVAGQPRAALIQVDGARHVDRGEPLAPAPDGWVVAAEPTMLVDAITEAEQALAILRRRVDRVAQAAAGLLGSIEPPAAASSGTPSQGARDE